MEWIRWMITIAAVAVAFYAGGEWGRDKERTAWLERDLKALSDQNQALNQKLDESQDATQTKVADMVKIQEHMERIARSTGSIGAQLKGTLDASNLGTCLLPDDTRRVRADRYEETGAATARARDARAKAQ